MKKLFALLVVLAVNGCVGSAFAWEVPGKPFKANYLLAGAMNKGIAPSQAGENGAYFMPISGLGLSPSGTSSYGFNVGEDLVFGHVVAIDATTANMTPWFGFGAGLFADFAPLITSNLADSPVILGSINVIGPQFEGVVPGAFASLNFQTGERRILVNSNIPLDPLIDALTFKAFGL